MVTKMTNNFTEFPVYFVFRPLTFAPFLTKFSARDLQKCTLARLHLCGTKSNDTVIHQRHTEIYICTK